MYVYLGVTVILHGSGQDGEMESPCNVVEMKTNENPPELQYEREEILHRIFPYWHCCIKKTTSSYD